MPGYSCNVATSLTAGIAGSIGGGGTLIGYTGLLQILPAELSWKPAGHNPLTDGDATAMNDCVEKAIRETAGSRARVRVAK